jgi:hypothetical protein
MISSTKIATLREKIIPATTAIAEIASCITTSQAAILLLGLTAASAYRFLRHSFMGSLRANAELLKARGLRGVRAGNRVF